MELSVLSCLTRGRKARRRERLAFRTRVKRRALRDTTLVARQVLIWGLPMDPIFADGAAKLRSRAAPSARIELQGGQKPLAFMSVH